MTDKTNECITIDIGTADPGHWCNECNRSTEVRFPISRMTEDGVLSLGHVSMCTDHDALDEERP